MSEPQKNIFKSIWEGWKKVAKAIGKVQTRIILFILYFLVIGPAAIVIRLLGKDLLDKRIDRKAKTLWKPYPAKKFSEESYRHEF